MITVSIARRLQDPLAELVKIEPKHIGVGMYQVRHTSFDNNLTRKEAGRALAFLMHVHCQNLFLHVL